jgi:hypothetical protein
VSRFRVELRTETGWSPLTDCHSKAEARRFLHRSFPFYRFHEHQLQSQSRVSLSGTPNPNAGDLPVLQVRIEPVLARVEPDQKLELPDDQTKNLLEG